MSTKQPSKYFEGPSFKIPDGKKVLKILSNITKALIGLKKSLEIVFVQFVWHILHVNVTDFLLILVDITFQLPKWSKTNIFCEPKINYFHEYFLYYLVSQKKVKNLSDLWNSAKYAKVNQLKSINFGSKV